MVSQKLEVSAVVDDLAKGKGLVSLNCFDGAFDAVEHRLLPTMIGGLADCYCNDDSEAYDLDLQRIVDESLRLVQHGR